MVSLKIRVDAGNGMGLGHLIRCLAIPQLFTVEELSSIFFIKETDRSLVEIVKSSNSQCVVIKQDSEFLDYLSKTDTVVLDGYHFTSEYEFQIRERVKRLIAIDDLQARHFYADAILNHTPGINTFNYSKEPYTEVYTGLKYFLLRKAFFAADRRSTAALVLEKGILCLGGEDAKNLTLTIAQSLNRENQKKKLMVIVGASYKHLKQLEDFAQNQHNIDIHVNINEFKLIELIKECDFAIVSASTISLECAYLRIPLYLVKTADNQLTNYDYCISHKIAFPLSTLEQYSFEIGQQMIQAQKDAFPTDITTNIKNIIKL